MTLDQILGIIGQVAIWATLVLVFLTLREMGEQRKASQKPDLILPKVPIFGYTIKGESELIVPTEWSNKELRVDETLIEHFPYITLYNIGVGAAKNIKLQWRFDLQGILQMISDYCHQNVIPIVVNVEGSWLEIDLKGYVYMLNADIFLMQEHEYVIPASATPQGIRSNLTPSFMGLFSVMVYMFIHQLHNKQGASSAPKPHLEFPPAHLELSYEDIGNAKYAKMFEMKFSAFAFMVPQKRSNREEVVRGVFEFIEKS